MNDPLPAELKFRENIMLQGWFMVCNSVSFLIIEGKVFRVFQAFLIIYVLSYSWISCPSLKGAYTN